MNGILDQLKAEEDSRRRDADKAMAESETYAGIVSTIDIRITELHAEIAQIREVRYAKATASEELLAKADALLKAADAIRGAREVLECVTPNITPVIVEVALELPKRMPETPMRNGRTPAKVGITTIAALMKDGMKRNSKQVATELGQPDMTRIVGICLADMTKRKHLRRVGVGTYQSITNA
jgi:energy-converting hydrogenase Eha subunit A